MFARSFDLGPTPCVVVRGYSSSVCAAEGVAKNEFYSDVRIQHGMHAGGRKKKARASFCDIFFEGEQRPSGAALTGSRLFPCRPRPFFFFFWLHRFLPSKRTHTHPLQAATTTKLKPAAAKKAAASPAKKAAKTGTVRIGGTKKVAPPPAAPARIATKKIAAAPSPSAGGGTRKVTALSVFEKGAQFSQRELGEASVRRGGGPPPRILTRVSQLRLLSKVEQSGLLSALERNGVTLSALEKSGALTLAESLGLLSRAADRSTPSLLYAVAFALFAAGPAAVYFIPDGSTAGVVAQAAIAAAAVAGGAAAFGGANLLSALQK